MGPIQEQFKPAHLITWMSGKGQSLPILVSARDGEITPQFRRSIPRPDCSVALADNGRPELLRLGGRQ